MNGRELREIMLLGKRQICGGERCGARGISIQGRFQSVDRTGYGVVIRFDSGVRGDARVVGPKWN